MTRVRILIILLFLLFDFAALALQKNVLFIGNSFTFYPGTWDHPALPFYVKQLLDGAGEHVNVDWVVHGGQTLRGHFEDPDVQKRLATKKYDFVIIQGHSAEAMELNECIKDRTFERPQGREEFLEYGAKLVELAQKNGAIPLLFETWTYEKGHPWLNPIFECYYDPDDTPWFGGSLQVMHQRIKEGYELLHEKTGAEVLPVGEMWWHIRMQPINALHLFASVLYNSQDKKHPTELGTYISALVVAKRIAGHAMVTPHFVPPAMTLRQAAYLNDMTSGAVQVSEHH